MTTDSYSFLKNRPYALMVIVALAVRLAVIPFLFSDWMDPFVLNHWAYGLVARSIIAGHGFGNVFSGNGGPTAVLAPIYTYLVVGIFKIFGVETAASVVATLSLNSLFSALTCVPVYLLAKQGFGDRVAMWAGWGWVFSPYGVYYGADWAWSTCLVTLALAWLFYFAWRLETNCRRGNWLLLGALCGVAALTEPVTLAVLPLLGIWTLYRRYRLGRSWKLQTLASAAAGLAILSPWIIRNYEVFHRFIPVRSGYGLELYIGNNGYSTRWVNSALQPNHSDAELGEYERDGEMAYMDHKKHQAMDYIRAHPGWYAWMTGRRIVYIWTGYWSLSREYLKDEPLDPPNIFVQTTLTILALFGLRRVFQLDKLRPDSALGPRFAIVLFLFPLAYYFSHPETYYFRPVDPLIVVLGAVAIAGRSRPQKPVPMRTL